MSQGGAISNNGGSTPPPIVVETLTGNTGVATASGNNIDTPGNNTGNNGYATWTVGSGDTLQINSYGAVKWVVNPVAGLGTHQTISAALTSASSGDDIIVVPGTYTENPQLKAGVNITAQSGDARTGQVTIIGKCSAPASGSCNLTNIRLQTNSDYALESAGTNTSTVNLYNCWVNSTNHTGINFASSSGSAQINVFDTTIDTTTTGISHFSHTSAGTMAFIRSTFANSGTSVTANNTTGSVIMRWCYAAALFSTSGTNGAYQMFYNFFDTGSLGVTLTHNSTVSGPGCQLFSCYLSNNTGAVLSIGAGSVAQAYHCTFNSGGTNIVTGAGSFSYSNLVMQGSCANINVSTQVPLYDALNPTYVSVTSGASPYTVTDINDYISVDSSGGAVTIKLPNAPTTYRSYTVKDRAGSAATHNITVTTVGGAVTIDGVTSYVMSANYAVNGFRFNGTSYEVF